MWRDIMRNLLLMGAVASLLAGQVGSAQAVEIKDDAGFFSQKALDKANAQLADLKKTNNKEVRIETFKTFPSGKADAVKKMDKAERARVFEKWARERATAEHAKGIFILICKDPGHVQVEDDKQTREQGFGSTERDELRDKLLAGFREKDYDKALLDAVDFISRTVKTKLKMHAEAEGVPITGQHHDAGRNHRSFDTPQQPARGMGWLGWVVVAVVVFLGFRLLGALFGGGMGGGYGGGYGPAGGGGMLGGLMTGLLGAVAGNWLYHSFFDSSAHAGESGWSGGGNDLSGGSDDGAGQDFEGSGGDFDNQDSGGGGDFGDSGGGDFGGGDFGGGDFGGGGDF